MIIINNVVYIQCLLQFIFLQQSKSNVVLLWQLADSVYWHPVKRCKKQVQQETTEINTGKFQDIVCFSLGSLVKVSARAMYISYPLWRLRMATYTPLNCLSLKFQHELNFADRDINIYLISFTSPSITINNAMYHTPA